MELIFNLLKIKESGPNEDIDVGLVVHCASHRFVPNLERHGEFMEVFKTCNRAGLQWWTRFDGFHFFRPGAAAPPGCGWLRPGLSGDGGLAQLLVEVLGTPLGLCAVKFEDESTSLCFCYLFMLFHAFRLVTVF